MRIDHLAIRVSDVDAISELMQKIGFKEVRRTDHHGGAVELIHPDQPDLTLEFTKVREDRHQVPGFDHAGFNITREFFDTLVESGFPAYDKPKLVPETGRYTSNWRDKDDMKWQFTFAADE